MLDNVFLGLPPESVRTWLDSQCLVTACKIYTTASCRSFSICSAVRDRVDQPLAVDWGDGTAEAFDGDISQLAHQYSTISVNYTIKLYNAKAFAFGDYLGSSSQQTLKEVSKMSKSIVSVGDSAFYRCEKLEHADISKSVASIGDMAFYGCSSLVSIDMCKSQVSAIGNEAFNGCMSLVHVSMPSCIASVGAMAFTGCSKLRSFSVAEGSLSYKSAAGLLLDGTGKTLLYGVNGDVVVPDGVKTVNDNAFQQHYGLSSIVLPSSIESIGEYAFEECSSLSSVDLGSSVTMIGDSAFNSTSSLTSIVLPDSVSKVGNYAFRDSHLVRISVPDTLTSFGLDAFYGCNDIMSVEIREADGIAEDVKTAMINAGVSPAAKWIMPLPDGTDYIEEANGIEWTFKVEEGKAVLGSSKDSTSAVDRSTSGNIEIPSKLGNRHVTSIGLSAFSQCNMIESIIAPNSIESISDSAFKGCSSLVAMLVPDSITSIHESAFDGCSIQNVIIARVVGNGEAVKSMLVAAGILESAIVVQ